MPNLLNNKKELVVVILCTVTVATIIGNIALINGSTITKLLQLTAFAFLGVLQLVLMQKTLASGGTKKVALCIVASFLLIVAALTLLLWIRGYYWPQIIAASAASFLLPSVLYAAWQLNALFFRSRRGVWQFIEGSASKQSVVSFNTVPIRIRFLPYLTSAAEKEIAFNAPIRMKLGTMFYHIIQEENETHGRNIDFEDKEGNLFYWEFYRQGVAGMAQSFLNPELSLAENDIKAGAVLVAKRITEPFEIVPTEFSNEQITS